ncbi:30S ribosomal protein S17 [Tessaracoccus sp.]
MSEETTDNTSAEVQIEERGRRKVLSGIVVSDKMDKTIVVMVEDRVKHPLYGKVMTKSTKLKAHDEENTAGIGDRVRVMETRPLSATKRWRLLEVIERAK